MGTGKTWLLVFCFVCSVSGAISQPVLENYPILQNTTQLRKQVIKLAESQSYVRELTGHNDGVQVERYLKSVGLRKGDQWCAAFISWLHIQNNIPNPESGFSPNWFKANLVYKKNQKRMYPFVSRPGQVIGFWVESKGRIGHVGMIISENKLHYNTIEGNTNIAGSDEGQGVSKLIRRKETAFAISDFVGWKEILQGLKNNNR